MSLVALDFEKVEDFQYAKIRNSSKDPRLYGDYQ